MGLVSAQAWPQVASPFGATVPVVTSCPRCSYLVEGTCLICLNEDPHPGCVKCVDGLPERDPWYLHPLTLAVGSAVVISLTVALVVPRLERTITGKRRTRR